MTRRTLLHSSLAGTALTAAAPGALAETDAPLTSTAVDGATTIDDADLRSDATIETIVTMAGASWTGDDPDHIDVRSRAENGQWRDWQPMELLTDIGEKATEAIWLGRSTAVEFRAARGRVDMTAELTAHLIETSPAPSDPGAGNGAGGTSAVGRMPALVTPATGAPGMFSRAEWGADESWARGSSTFSELKSVVIHHTAGCNRATKAESPRSCAASTATTPLPSAGPTSATTCSSTTGARSSKAAAAAWSATSKAPTPSPSTPAPSASP